jgi:peptide chain release factor subunit 1
MKNHELKERIERVADAEGEGTELVTLSIPDGKSLQSTRTRIDQEHAEAANIKSDHTRKRVQNALQRVSSVLKRYKRTPENGLVVYAGVINGDMTEFVFDDLPSPVTESIYTCSNEFVLDPIEHIITPDNTYGLIVIERGGASFGRLVGDRVIHLRTMESMVMGKTRAGGQSAQRFARERERQKQEFFQRVGKGANQAFLDRGGDDGVGIDGLLIGGTTITVDEFLDSDDLDYRLRDRLIGTHTVDHASEQGLQQLAEQSTDDVLDAERHQAREALNQFFTALGTGEEPVTYGADEVETALEYGAVDTLLVSEALPLDRIRDLEQETEGIGGETVVVSTDFDRGEQLQSVFGGIAALLRYPIN